MHFSLWEKFGASVLLSAWLIYGAHFLGNKLVYVEQHHAAGHTTATAGPPAAQAEAKPEADLGTLLAAATPEQGAKVFGKCKACHTIEQGGKAAVGPNLWNVVGGPKAHMEGFAYSDGMASRHDQKWTYENLNTFLTSPKDYVPGTKMSFAGLKEGAERAAVIRYLAANTQSPPPLPEPAPKAAVSAPATAAPKADAAAAAVPAEAPPATAAAAPADVGALMASADAAAGEKVFGKCKSCHTIEKDGKNGVGPNLWGVVGGPRAHKDDFSYSGTLAGMHDQKWTYENLYVFLESPKDYIKGTKMSFAGLKKPEERANVIAYLRSMSDNPPPLP